MRAGGWQTRGVGKMGFKRSPPVHSGEFLLYTVTVPAKKVVRAELLIKMHRSRSVSFSQRENFFFLHIFFVRSFKQMDSWIFKPSRIIILFFHKKPDFDLK